MHKTGEENDILKRKKERDLLQLKSWECSNIPSRKD